MEIPKVPNPVVYKKSNITVILWASRKLSDPEKAIYARNFAQTKKLKRNSKHDVYLTV